MTKKDKRPTVVKFDPSFFDSFDGSQEELDSLVAEIERMVEDGSFFDEAQVLDFDSMFSENPEEAFKLALDFGLLSYLVDEDGNIVDPDIENELTEEEKKRLVDLAMTSKEKNTKH